MIASRFRSPRRVLPSRVWPSTTVTRSSSTSCSLPASFFATAIRPTVCTMTTSEATGGSYLPVMLNPFEPGYFDDPYAQYAAVREADPIHQSPIGVLVLFRYDDVH